MKYTYVYKTSDGVRREESMNASSREEVFTQLRKQGIKAIKVIAADGSKANGEIRGITKNAVLIIAGFVALIVGGIAYIFGSYTASKEISFNESTFLVDLTRRQVIGDAAIIEKNIKEGWANVFKLKGERFLASFAIPGAKAGQRNTSERDLMEALSSHCVITSSDSLEIQQIKSMVEGMKIEAREYLSNGGNIIEYGKRLIERQEQEIEIYNRVKIDIERKKESMPADEYMKYWEKRNAELRNLGIKTISLEIN